MQMIILGIDPGTAITGYGVIQTNRSGQVRALTHGVLRTQAKQAASARLQNIYDGICSLMDEFQPRALAIEQLFFNRNVTTALAVGQARGVIILAAAKGGIEVAEYTPLQVKQAVTGRGRADKEQVGYMVRVLLGLGDIPKPDDAADALAVGICHAFLGRGWRGQP